MTLHVYKDLEQRSDEWYELRRGIVTASTVGQLITASTIKPASNTASRALTLSLLTERITGIVEPTYQSPDMYRGVVCEPIARDLYSERYAPVDQCGFMVRDDWGWRIGYSPDGLVGDDGLIEIKCPQPKEHVRTILADAVPAQYMAQCQAALLVSGREWLDFVSFSGGLPLYVKRVEPDTGWRWAIGHAVNDLEESVLKLHATYDHAVEGLPATERVDYDMEMVI